MTNGIHLSSAARLSEKTRPPQTATVAPIRMSEAEQRRLLERVDLLADGMLADGRTRATA